MSHTDTFLIAIAVLVAISVLLQIGFVIGAAIMGSRALRLAKEYGDDFRSVSTPALQHAREVLESTQKLIARLEPRLDAAASDLAEMVQAAREETRNIQASADEIAERIRKQAERMDTMTTTALNGVDRVGQFLNVPVRQVSGVVAALKAIVDALRTPAPPRSRAAQNAHADD
jgi:gas vesicle protein